MCASATASSVAACSGKAVARCRQHQARLRFVPSRWAILPSLRSLTVTGWNRLAGSPWSSRGRKAANQSLKASGGITRLMHSASVRAEDRNSSPPGSQAWQSRSALYQSCARRRISLAKAGGAPPSAMTSAKACC